MTVRPQSGTDNRTAGRREGRRRRDEAHLLLLARRGRFVRLAQAALLDAITEHGEASADDIRSRLTLPPDIDPTLIGPAVRQLRMAGVIKRVGRDAESSRPIAHGRPLPLWSVTTPEAAQQWRTENPPPSPVDDTTPPAASPSEPAPIDAAADSPADTSLAATLPMDFGRNETAADSTSPGQPSGRVQRLLFDADAVERISHAA